MTSETSSDIDINNDKKLILPSLKKDTTETDFYLNLVANPSKTLLESEKSSSSLHFNNDEQNKSITSSVNNYDDNSSDDDNNNVKIPEFIKKNSIKREKSRKSSKLSSSSSKAQYEKVHISSTRHSNRSHTDKNDTDKPSKTPELTPQQLRMKKIDLLRKLSDIKSKGFKLTKEYDFNSSIEEMEYEYDLLKSFVDRRNGLKLYKNTIMNISSIIEFVNGKYDPFGIKLDGWSEHMSVEVDSYDDVMEELYEKYKSSGKSMPPELKLFLLVGASASAFHFSKAFLSKTPGLDGIMNMQPALISKLVSNNNPSQFMSEQELNIMRQKQELQEKDKMIKQQMKEQQMQQMQQMQQQQMQQMQQQQMQPPQMKQPSFDVPLSTRPFFMQQNQQPNTPITKQPENFQNFHQSVNFNNPTPIGTPSQLIQSNDPRSMLPNNTLQNTNKPTIKASESVRDILNKLHSRDTDTIDTLDDSTNNDRLVSDTMSDSNKSKTKKTKKTLMSVL